MDEFLLIFRRDYTSKEGQRSPEQMQADLKIWQEWLGGIAAQDRLARPLQRWDSEGMVVRQNLNVVNGPYAEIKEAIGGLIVIKAAGYDEAVAIANGCPILLLGGNVEIRRAIKPEV